MNILGIVVEYNPFHNGHKYHIEHSKKVSKSDKVVAVMSGNFVQRGEPSIMSKYSRTKIALENGVDMVLELPTVYATSSAELFSHAAVSILHKTNIINSLCFGSEVGSVVKLQSVADILTNEPQEFKTQLKEELSKGLSFPKAREIALETLNPDLQGILSSPNNILGVEYLKSLNKLKSNIQPYTITRSVAEYHDTTLIQGASIASATSLRKIISTNDIELVRQYVPFETYNELNGYTQAKLYSDLENIFIALKFKLTQMSISELHNIYDITEGLGELLINKIQISTSYLDLVQNLKSKRYTQTKIQRMLIHLLLNITNQDIELYKTIDYIPYIRVLGFRKDSSELLKKLTSESSVPVVTNIKNADLCSIGTKMLCDEFVFTNIYNQLVNQNFNKQLNNIPLSALNFEQRQPLVIV